MVRLLLVLQTTSYDHIDWVEALGPVLVGVLVGALAFLSSFLVLRHQRRESRRNEIYKQLNEFYGPLEQLMLQNKILHQVFSARLKAENEGFGALVYVLSQGMGDLKDYEKIILDEIIVLGEEVEALIHTKAGLVNNEDLSDKWLPQLTAHTRFMRLAVNHESELSRKVDQLDLFNKYEFPERVNDLLDQEIVDLRCRLYKLNNGGLKRLINWLKAYRNHDIKLPCLLPQSKARKSNPNKAIFSKENSPQP